jgi:hypothetical protein
MADLVTDQNDPRLGYGADDEETPQQEAYLVLPKEERERGKLFPKRPFRDTYTHKVCGTNTRMSKEIAETYARDPKFYGSTYCLQCKKHLLVSEFVWEGTNELVGS